MGGRTQGPALRAGGCPGQGRRREVDAARGVHAEHSGGLGLGQVFLRVRAARPQQERQGGPARQGGQHQGVPGGFAERGAQPGPGRVDGLPGHGGPVPLRSGKSRECRAGHGSQQRVAAAMALQRARPAGGQAVCAEQGGRLLGVERVHVDLGGVPAEQPGGGLRPPLDAFGDDRGEPGGREGAQRVAEDVGAGRIEPLGTVHGQDPPARLEQRGHREAGGQLL